MSKEYDVVVVGAGIFGLATAYHIKKSEPEKEILVIDRYGDAGQGNTGRSNAMFRNTFTSVDNQTLADASIDYYSHVQNELGFDIGVDMMGYLWLLSERQLSASESHVSAMVDNGIEIKRYDRDSLKASIPSLVLDQKSAEADVMGLESVEGSIFGPKCGRLAPDRLASFYKDSLLKIGGRFLFNAEASELLAGPEKPLGLNGEPFVWQEHRISGVRLADGRELKADTTIVACGAWNNELLDPLGIDGRCKSKKRQLFAVKAAGKPSLEGLLHQGGFNSSAVLPFVILPKSGLFIKAVRESGEFWVGCEDEVKREFITSPQHDLDKYQAEPAYYEMNVYQVLKEYFPDFTGAKPHRMWAGLYSYNTLDNMPYIFGDDGLVVAGGDSGSGIMKGDSIGRLVAAFYGRGDDAEAELYGGKHYRVSKLGFKKRDVEREEWVI